MSEDDIFFNDELLSEPYSFFSQLNPDGEAILETRVIADTVKKDSQMVEGFYGKLKIRKSESDQLRKGDIAQNESGGRFSIVDIDVDAMGWGVIRLASHQHDREELNLV